jgi:hypothetical protein
MPFLYLMGYTSWLILLALILAIKTTWFFVMYQILLGYHLALAVKIPRVKIVRLPRGFFYKTRKTGHTLLKTLRSSYIKMEKYAHL